MSFWKPNNTIEMFFVSARHQTGATYSAVEWTKARMAERITMAQSSQLHPGSFLKNPTQVVNYLRSDSKCRRNVSPLSNFVPR